MSALHGFGACRYGDRVVLHFLLLAPIFRYARRSESSLFICPFHFRSRAPHYRSPSHCKKAEFRRPGKKHTERNGLKTGPVNQSEKSTVLSIPSLNTRQML